MEPLNLKASHKVVKDYYAEIENLTSMHLFSEGNVSPAFANLLRHCARQYNWTLAEQYPLTVKNKNIRPDGALIDQFELVHGLWEAKDSQDDLALEVKKKFDKGYPKENILFQEPERAIIWQNGVQVFDEPLKNPDNLIACIDIFVRFRPPEIEEWEQAVEEFKLKVPELGASLLNIIEQERKQNKAFVRALQDFMELCRAAINPNLSEKAVEEMLIQHLLTERIFRNVFNNPDFANRNIIAHEIEKVIQALTSRSFSKHEFLKKLDRFYTAIELTASTIDDYTRKQAFLNTVYENFFQGFSVKVADTHGIVYTPQPVVHFMVNSVEAVLNKEFNRSLSDKNVHILDPFVGTGNFIINVMRKMKKTSLAHKFRHELHCNEVMLLPYYIASMNIEHEYYELTGEYVPFDGICLVDTFELAEDKQFSLFTAENTERVQKQMETPIFVVIGNPPYNAGQVNENDNNKNRKYPVIDQRVRDTYTRDSNATNKNALSDVYVKAIRWASDRVLKNGEGIVALITNNSYIDDFAFDGMRKHLHEDFDDLYIIDLKGNVRKDSMRDGIPLGEKHTIFGLSAMVGISIAVLVKHKKPKKKQIDYFSVDFRATRDEKLDILEKAENIFNLQYKNILPDAKHNWLTEGMRQEFDGFVPLGTKDAKHNLEKSIFHTYSRGVATCRDAWAYNFCQTELIENITNMIDYYNEHVYKWSKMLTKPEINSFVDNDDKKISWSRDLKQDMVRERTAQYHDNKLKPALYRPFSKQYLFFDRIINEEIYQFHHYYPLNQENKIIGLSAPGNTKPFHCIMTDIIADLHLTGDSQCFPFYTYDEDGSNQRENISDWALDEFRSQYNDKTITKWDIFYYVYGLLHHPQYRETYQANLRRELPRLPWAPDFWAFSHTGKQLGDLHVHYEQQDEYPLDMVETPEMPLDWRVEKMRLTPDKSQLIYNDFLTLAGIPQEVFEYRLGNRSALDWIIDQYRVKTDKRSGIVNDPNRPDDPEYIVRLVKQIITVSLKTVEIVKGLPKIK